MRAASRTSSARLATNGYPDLAHSFEALDQGGPPDSSAPAVARRLDCTFSPAPHTREAVNMRKQDRIVNQQQNHPQESSNKESQRQPREREQVKGSASEMQRPPQRQPGKLPLPD
jgi:hypothetical protein